MKKGQPAEVIEAVEAQVFIPLTVGGGIRKVRVDIGIRAQPQRIFRDVLSPPDGHGAKPHAVRILHRHMAQSPDAEDGDGIPRLRSTRLQSVESRQSGAKDRRGFCLFFKIKKTLQEINNGEVKEIELYENDDLKDVAEEINRITDKLKVKS